MLRRLIRRRRGWPLHAQRGAGTRPFRSSRVGVVGGAVARATKVSIEDLVQPLWRHQHRLRRHFPIDEIRHSFLVYEEWRIRVSCRQLYELLRIPKVAELLQNFFLGSPSLCRVVWLSDSHFLLCAGREEGLTLLSGFPVLCSLDCNDSRGQAASLCSFFDLEGPDPDEADILRAVHGMVALSSRIAVVNANIDVIPATVVEAMVAQAQSPRTVNVYADQPHTGEDGNLFVVSAEIGRTLAFSCSAQVELIAILEEWEDLGASLTAAMVANRCPTRLVLSGLDDPETASIVAPALECTVRIETLTICMDGGHVADSVLDAIGRNKGIRTLVVDSFSSSSPFLEALWEAVMVSPSIRSVEFRGPAMVYDDWERIESAETVARLIRSNHALSYIQYDPMNHDENIMESRVTPILFVNRLRPIMKGLVESAGAAGGERVASLLLGTPLVQRHPELVYFVLKSCHGHLCLTGDHPPPKDDSVSAPTVSERETRARCDRWSRVLQRPTS